MKKGHKIVVRRMTGSGSPIFNETITGYLYLQIDSDVEIDNMNFRENKTVIVVRNRCVDVRDESSINMKRLHLMTGGGG